MRGGTHGRLTIKGLHPLRALLGALAILAASAVATAASQAADYDPAVKIRPDMPSVTVETGDGGQQAVQEQEENDADDTQLEVEPLSDEAAQMSEAAEESRSHERGSKGSRTGAVESRSDATLSALADTYATDILVFEWLTDLVASAGPAATLRAIAYYEEIEQQFKGGSGSAIRDTGGRIGFQ